MKASNASSTRRAVGVYIFSDDGARVLLTQRGPGARHEPFTWEGPGGAVEPGETYEQAAHREIREELGIGVELGPIIAEFESVIDAHGTIWEAKIFRATTTETPSIQEPEKCVGFGWFTPEEIPRLNLTSYARKDLEMFGGMVE